MIKKLLKNCQKGQKAAKGRQKVAKKLVPVNTTLIRMDISRKEILNN